MVRVASHLNAARLSRFHAYSTYFICMKLYRRVSDGQKKFFTAFVKGQNPTMVPWVCCWMSERQQSSGVPRQTCSVFEEEKMQMIPACT